MSTTVYYNTVFSIVPVSAAASQTFDIYNLRTSQKFAPQ